MRWQSHPPRRRSPRSSRAWQLSPGLFSGVERVQAEGNIISVQVSDHELLPFCSQWLAKARTTPCTYSTTGLPSFLLSILSSLQSLVLIASCLAHLPMSTMKNTVIRVAPISSVRSAAGGRAALLMSSSKIMYSVDTTRAVKKYL